MLTPVELMSTCTVRVVGIKAYKEISIGTGFLYFIKADDLPDDSPEGQNYPVLITNKHVIEGCDTVKLVVSVAPIGSKTGLGGLREGRRHHTVTLSIKPAGGIGAVFHPSPIVDLAAIPVASMLRNLSTLKLDLLHAFVHPRNHLPIAEREYLRALEPIVMVGYPSGLWDSVANAPILRRGSTATHALVPYEGKPVFLIDAACFQGSSGSPVFLFEDGMYRSGPNSISPGSRLSLLGVLYAGPQFNAEGLLIEKPIPHSVTTVPYTNIPMNLGMVIWADEINQFRAEFKKLEGN